MTIWVLTRHSESGDTYSPVTFDHKPTAADVLEAVKDTGEEMNGGPGYSGSYIHVDVYKTICKQKKSVKNC